MGNSALLLLLLSILVHKLASGCNTETTNHYYTVMYDGRRPVLRTSKFKSVYRIYDPFEENIHMIIRKRRLLVSSCRKLAVTLFKI
jgi:hypothetical protein